MEALHKQIVIYRFSMQVRMPCVCGLDCNLVRNDSQISESRIFVGRKKLTTEKNHIYMRDLLDRCRDV